MISEPTESAAGSAAEELARDAKEILDRCQAELRSGLEELVESLPVEISEAAQYHLGLLPGARPGKALRPTLTLVLAEALGAPREPALALGLAVQLVHDFSLLHDDIVDQDRSRRGQPTLWVKEGMATALNTGDGLLAAAFQVISGADLAPITGSRAALRLSRATLEMVGGQEADIASTRAPIASLAAYLETVGRKTGALMGAAAALGAIAAAASEATVAACDRFGRTLGVAFQLRDDVLGVFGDAGETGKPVGNDLLRGKQGLPMVLALTGNGSLGKAAKGWLEPPGMDRSDLRGAVQMLRQGGVAERCQGLTTTWTERALESCARLPLAPAGAAQLELLCRWLGERWY